MRVGIGELSAELRRLFLLAQRKARTDGGRLTKPSLAKRIGVSTSSLYAYLAGTTLPPSEVFDALLIGLGVNGTKRADLATARDHIASRRRAEPAPPDEPATATATASATAQLRFAILGPLHIQRSGNPVPLTGLRQRTLLTALLLEHGRPVCDDRLADSVWDGRPPANWRGDMQAHISRLRRLLGPAVLMRAHDGYLVPHEAGSLDLTEFDRLTACAGNHPTPAACTMLREALALWRGPALSDVTPRLAHAAALGLNERRLSAWERCLELELSLGGRHAHVLDDLRELVAAHPQRQRPRELLRRALAMTGQPTPVSPVHPVYRLAGQVVTPQELPPDVPAFVGREPELEEIEALAGYVERAGSVVVSALSGPPGVGKSALAIHAAYRIKQLFPDGQLYADLRATSSPTDVLTRFLRSLAGAGQLHPDSTVEELAARFRSQVAGKRLLVLLDNAHSVAQVRPLLPGTPTAMVLVTSRRLLPLMHGAVHRGVPTLPHDCAIDLLSRLLGRGRTSAEPAAVAALARLCGNLPLALCIAAARLTERPHWPIALLVKRLGDEQERLSELQIAGQSVRGSFAASYAELAETPAAARLFRLLGLLSGHEFTAASAAVLADLTETATERLLETLTSAQLLESPGPGRYRMHDLLRFFAREHISGEEMAVVLDGFRAAPECLAPR